MGEVKGQGHIVHPASCRCTSFSFHMNRTNHSWDMSTRVFDLEKSHPNFWRKFAKKGFLTKFLQNLIRWWPWLEAYSYQVLWWLVEWFSLYPADKQIFVYQCHSHDLGSRSPKGHPVHFPRPTLSLSQISKVYLKRFWHEKQKSLRRRRWWRTRWRKRTENIKSPQTGVI